MYWANIICLVLNSTYFFHCFIYLLNGKKELITLLERHATFEESLKGKWKLHESIIKRIYSLWSSFIFWMSWLCLTNTIKTNILLISCEGTLLSVCCIALFYIKQWRHFSYERVILVVYMREFIHKLCENGRQIMTLLRNAFVCYSYSTSRDGMCTHKTELIRFCSFINSIKIWYSATE